MFREDGYINMTKAAKHFGKRLPNFWRSPDTGDYLLALSQVAQIETLTAVNVKMGRGGGTFCHPTLAVFFARWLSPHFAVWCDLMIDNILKGNIQTVVTVPTSPAYRVLRMETEGTMTRIPIR